MTRIIWAWTEKSQTDKSHNSKLQSLKSVNLSKVLLIDELTFVKGFYFCICVISTFQSVGEVLSQ